VSKFTNKFTRKRIFRGVWNTLAEAGRVDAAGGAEYRRLYRQWIQAGSPSPLGFLTYAANRLNRGVGLGQQKPEPGKGE